MVGAADVAAAVAAALRAALGAVDFGAEPVYVGKGPTDPDGSVPYLVVYVQPPLGDGTAADTNADLTFTVQVSAVSNGYDSAARIGDAARTALLAPWTPPAGAVLQGPVKLGAGQQPSADYDTTSPLFYGYELVTLVFTPAA